MFPLLRNWVEGQRLINYSKHVNFTGKKFFTYLNHHVVAEVLNEIQHFLSQAKRGMVHLKSMA
jgi:hypothetical protein